MFMHLFLCVFICTWLYMGMFCYVLQEASHQRHHLCFDQGKCSKHITLSNRGKRATHCGDQCANVTTTEGYTTGIHQWSVKLLKLDFHWFAGAGVSVLPQDGDYSTTSQFFGRHRAYYWWDNGYSHHCENSNEKLGEKCSECKEGDVMTFTLDCEQRTLHVLISRTGESATLKDLVVTSPLYPTVCMSGDYEVELC